MVSTGQNIGYPIRKAQPVSVSAPQSLHASSNNPLFDAVMATTRRKTRRRLAPVTAGTILVDRASNPVLAAMATSQSAGEPLSADDLTPTERELVSEMSDTVTKLVLRLLDDDTKSTRRRPFHAVEEAGTSI